jgi:hypothetical protein
LESKARKVTGLKKYTVAIRNGAPSSGYKLIASFRKQKSYGVRNPLRRFSSSYALVCDRALEEGHSTTLPKYNSYITVLRGIWFLRRVRNFSAVQLTFG